jgi:hypothetical protein
LILDLGQPGSQGEAGARDDAVMSPAQILRRGASGSQRPPLC